MSEPSDTDPADDPVLGPVPTLPDGIWNDLLERTFAADPDEADDSLVPDDASDDDADSSMVDEWSDDDVGADAHGIGSDSSAEEGQLEGHLDVPESTEHHHDLPDLPGLL